MSDCVKKNTIRQGHCIHQKNTYLCGFGTLHNLLKIFKKEQLKMRKDCDSINSTARERSPKYNNQEYGGKIDMGKRKWLSQEHAVQRLVKWCGVTFSTVPAVDMGSIVIKEALKRAGVPADQVDHVYMGCVIQAGLDRTLLVRLP